MAATAKSGPLAEAHVPAGEFKARCLKLIEEVNRTHKPIVITKRGKPMVRLVPYQAEVPELYGALEGWITIKGDILAPIDVEWDAER